MTWYFIHFTYSLDPEADCSPTCSSDTDRSEPSRSTRTVAEFCSADRLTDDYLNSQFGTTFALLGLITRIFPVISIDCEPSGMNSVSLADFLVRTFPPLVRELVSEATSQVYGQSLPELSGRYDPDMRSWRTPRNLFGEGLTLSPETWSAWGIVLHGAYYPRRPLAPSTSDADSGRLQKETFPTPTVNTAKNSATESQRRRKTLDLLNYVVKYPTPMASAYGGCTGARRKIRQMDNLTDEEKRSLCAGNFGTLNPDWAEWLMGWPAGWTQTEPERSGKTTRRAYLGYLTELTTGSSDSRR